MQLIFFDTEFTDFQHADLISIALTAEDGRELYVSITDYKRHLASDFVENIVLPRLELPDAKPILASRFEAARLIAEYLQEVPDICLVSDAEVDGMLLRRLLKRMRSTYPRFALAQHLVTSDQARQLMENVEQALTEHPGRHNALIDARALKAAMNRLPPCEKSSTTA